MSRPSFSIDLLAPGPPEDVWQRLWNLDRHTETVPLTTVTGGPLGPGARFTGRTGVGPVGFDDDMVVLVWEPPRHAMIEKVGRVLHGTIDVTLASTSGGTHVRWHQSYGASLVPDRLAALVRPAVRAAYLLALRRIIGT